MFPQTTAFLQPESRAVVENERFIRRHARTIWLGYSERAAELAEILQKRDRRIDDRRLCVECANAGMDWRCRKKQGFLTHVLQRCAYFEDAN